MSKSQTKEPQSKMNSEKELLLLCLSPGADSDRERKIQERIQFSPDWQKIARISYVQGVAALLYYNLKKIQFLDSLNPQVSSYLQDNYLYNLKRNITLWKELSQVINLFKKEKIELLFFKGIILCHTLYPDPGLRKFSDADAIIKENDLAIIRKILKERGYIEKRQKSTFLFAKKIKPDLNLYLELHTKIKPLRPYEVKISQLWQRSESKIIFGSQVRFPSWEDSFILLCLHIKKHSQSISLKFISDIAQIISLYCTKMDWDYIEKVAIKNRVKNNIYFCLYLSKELFNIHLPDYFLDKFNADSFNRKLIRVLVNRNNFIGLSVWRGYILRVILLDRPGDFFVYLKKLILAKR